jgi:A/G-specific adenine glycosylase
LLAVLRDAPGPVEQHELDAVWDLPEQRDRALAGLIADGLAESAGDGRYRLPT